MSDCCPVAIFSYHLLSKSCRKMNLRIVILPAKVLADGTHKIRIAISHKGQTRYFVTRFIVPGPEYLHDGQVVGLNNASYINQQLRIRMSKIYAICDQATDIEYYTCSQLVQYMILVNASLRLVRPPTRKEPFVSTVMPSLILKCSLALTTSFSCSPPMGCIDLNNTSRIIEGCLRLPYLSR